MASTIVLAPKIFSISANKPLCFAQKGPHKRFCFRGRSTTPPTSNPPNLTPCAKEKCQSPFSFLQHDLPKIPQQPCINFSPPKWQASRSAVRRTRGRACSACPHAPYRGSDFSFWQKCTAEKVDYFVAG